MRGIAKHLLRRPGRTRTRHQPSVLETHTAGFDAYQAPACGDRLLGGAERAVGRARESIRAAGEIYTGEVLASSPGAWHPVSRNTGWRGPGDCDVLLLRGKHRPRRRRPLSDSRPQNVQGNRTCGVDHRPREVAGAPWTPPAASPRPAPWARHGADDQGHASRRRQGFLAMAAISRWPRRTEFTYEASAAATDVNRDQAQPQPLVHGRQR